MSPKAVQLWNLAGWLLFILSAVFFLISSILAADPYAIVGSLAFLIACLVFLIPLMSFLRNKGN
jgi:O-antigen ligase